MPSAVEQRHRPAQAAVLANATEQPKGEVRSFSLRHLLQLGVAVGLLALRCPGNCLEWLCTEFAPEPPKKSPS